MASSKCQPKFFGQNILHLSNISYNFGPQFFSVKVVEVTETYMHTNHTIGKTEQTQDKPFIVASKLYQVECLYAVCFGLISRSCHGVVSVIQQNLLPNAVIDKMYILITDMNEMVISISYLSYCENAKIFITAWVSMTKCYIACRLSHWSQVINQSFKSFIIDTFKMSITV